MRCNRGLLIQEDIRNTGQRRLPIAFVFRGETRLARSANRATPRFEISSAEVHRAPVLFRTLYSADIYL